MSVIEESYDIVVIGAGHAGCEAALAGAPSGALGDPVYGQRGQYCPDALHPNIGGTSKGHLVREIDALGGEMGKEH